MKKYLNKIGLVFMTLLFFMTSVCYSFENKEVKTKYNLDHLEYSHSELSSVDSIDDLLSFGHLNIEKKVFKNYLNSNNEHLIIYLIKAKKSPKKNGIININGDKTILNTNIKKNSINKNAVHNKDSLLNQTRFFSIIDYKKYPFLKYIA